MGVLKTEMGHILMVCITLEGDFHILIFQGTVS
jgi:hypothetical protein